MESESEFSLPASVMMEQSSLLSSEEKDQEDAVARFASLLSTGGSRDIVQILSDAVSSNDVVCTVPSLDMQSIDESGVNPLPAVGEHRKKTSTTDIPKMKASILDQGELRNLVEREEESGAARVLSSPTSWTKSSLAYAADAMSKNVWTAFQSLIDSRLRAWTLLLLKHSLSTGDDTSRSRLLGILSFRIRIKSCQTSFTTLPLPDEARGQPRDADVILPLLFQTEIKLSMPDHSEPIMFQAPGTISGDFSNDVGSPGLTNVVIRLDCAAFLECMIEQARLVVFRAVARATAPSVASSARRQTPTVPPPPAPKPSVSFAAALSLSEDATDSSPALQKARSSALRLNTILEGSSGKSRGSSAIAEDTLSPLVHKTSNKSRSVTWNNLALEQQQTAPGGTIPSPKRQRMGSAKKLRSMKSFGRPHAGDGYDGRNATFGDFGRTPLAAGPVWGKDGRLKNHPLPGGGQMSSQAMLMNPDETSNAKNATFDMQQPAWSASAAVDALLQNPSATRDGASLPRTATALENWLVNAAKSGTAKGIL